MEYIKYKKNFVMLEEKNGEFAARQELPIKGYIKTETGNGKGALRISVQNLKFFEKGTYIYKLIFFGKKREKTIYSSLGTLMLNKFGNGETYLRFNPRDVDGNGHKLSDFSHIIIAALSVRNEKEALHPVLMGAFDIPSTEDERVEPRGIEEEEGRCANSVGGTETEGAESGTGKDEEKTEEREETANAAGVRVSERKNYNRFYNKYLLDNCKTTEAKAEMYDEIVPFKNDITKANWRKISNVTALPVVAPGAHYFASKYRHYIFGINDRRYFFGVPGRFLREEQPDKGESGFVLWQPIIGAEKLGPFSKESFNENYKSAYGYWIASIDKITGDIQEPN